MSAFPGWLWPKMINSLIMGRWFFGIKGLLLERFISYTLIEIGSPGEGPLQLAGSFI